MHDSIDIKLLQVIHTVAMTKSVSVTARHLGTSAGTISYWIGKARKVTRSHLFTRTRQGMLPDTTALELSQRYQEYLLKTSGPGNSRSHSERKVRIHTNSLLEMIVSEYLPDPAKRKKPRHYAFKPYIQDVSARTHALETGKIDLDIGPKLPANKAISAVRLFRSGVSILTGKDNPRYGDQLTLEEWYGSQFISWSGISDYWCDDIATSASVHHHLAGRTYGVLSGSLINTLLGCASTEFITLVPTLFVDTLVDIMPVRPVAVPPQLSLYYECFVHFNHSLVKEKEVFLEISHLIDSVQRRLQDKPDASLRHQQPFHPASPGHHHART
ncbi:LysR family transcriptional regulator [Enterobacteriaceae bacterium 89]|nr:LysR family transcriptional regulator [Enterobacteriaceae bacterium 89]